MDRSRMMALSVNLTHFKARDTVVIHGSLGCVGTLWQTGSDPEALGLRGVVTLSEFDIVDLGLQHKVSLIDQGGIDIEVVIALSNSRLEFDGDVSVLIVASIDLGSTANLD